MAHKFLCHIPTPGPSKSLSQMNTAPMEGVHSVSQSQAGLCGWAALQSQGLQVSAEPHAANDVPPRMTASESWCL